MDHISRAFEWVSVVVLILAFLLAVLSAARDLNGGVSPRITYERSRAILGRGILVGLEILVVADLVKTVAVEPTFANVGVLGLIVLIRTVLSFALDVEIDGVLPWRRRQLATDGPEP